MNRLNRHYVKVIFMWCSNGSLYGKAGYAFINERLNGVNISIAASNDSR